MTSKMGGLDSGVVSVILDLFSSYIHRLGLWNYKTRGPRGPEIALLGHWPDVNPKTNATGFRNKESRNRKKE